MEYLERTPRDWLSQRLVPAERLPYLGAPAGTRLRVVAKEGAIDDWAAYAHLDKYGPEAVAEHGQKLFPDDAAEIFPLFDPKRYRE